jgi:hypothetical protein
VRIRQVFSSDLLGVPAGFWRRDDDFGLNREHVYYRSLAPSRPTSPALLTLMLAIGVRIGEALAVLRRQIDLEAGTAPP